MVIVDYILLAIVALSALIGLFRGFVKEALSLVVWGGAIWCAWKFGEPVAIALPDFLSDPILKLWASRILVLIAVLIIGGMLTWLISFLLDRTGLTGTDRAVGMIFGLIRGAVLAALVIIIMEAADFDQAAWWQESRLIPVAAPITNLLRELADEGIEKFQAS